MKPLSKNLQASKAANNPALPLYDLKFLSSSAFDSSIWISSFERCSNLSIILCICQWHISSIPLRARFVQHESAICGIISVVSTVFPLTFLKPRKYLYSFISSYGDLDFMIFLFSKCDWWNLTFVFGRFAHLYVWESAKQRSRIKKSNFRFL